MATSPLRRSPRTSVHDSPPSSPGADSQLSEDSHSESEPEELAWLEWSIGQIIRVPSQHQNITIRAPEEPTSPIAAHSKAGRKRLPGELAIVAAIYADRMIVLPILNDHPAGFDPNDRDEFYDSHSAHDDDPISMDVIDNNPHPPYRAGSAAESQVLGRGGNFLRTEDEGPQALEIKVGDYINLNEVVSVEFGASVEHVSDLVDESVELLKKRYAFVHGPFASLAPEEQDDVLRRHVAGEQTGFEPKEPAMSEVFAFAKKNTVTERLQRQMEEVRERSDELKAREKDLKTQEKDFKKRDDALQKREDVLQKRADALEKQEDEFQKQKKDDAKKQKEDKTSGKKQAKPSAAKRPPKVKKQTVAVQESNDEEAVTTDAPAAEETRRSPSVAAATDAAEQPNEPASTTDDVEGEVEQVSRQKANNKWTCGHILRGECQEGVNAKCKHTCCKEGSITAPAGYKRINKSGKELAPLEKKVKQEPDTDGGSSGQVDGAAAKNAKGKRKAQDDGDDADQGNKKKKPKVASKAAGKPATKTATKTVAKPAAQKKATQAGKKRKLAEVDQTADEANADDEDDDASDADQRTARKKAKVGGKKPAAAPTKEGNSDQAEQEQQSNDEAEPVGEAPEEVQDDDIAAAEEHAQRGASATAEEAVEAPLATVIEGQKEQQEEEEEEKEKEEDAEEEQE